MSSILHYTFKIILCSLNKLKEMTAVIVSNVLIKLKILAPFLAIVIS